MIIWLFTLGNWLGLPFRCCTRMTHPKRGQMTKININYSWRSFFVSSAHPLTRSLAGHFISIILRAYCFHHSSVRSATITVSIHISMGHCEMNLFRVTKERWGMCQALKATISAFQKIFFSFSLFPESSLSRSVLLFVCRCQFRCGDCPVFEFTFVCRWAQIV